ncbi:MAG: flagellar biosynthesis protein FlhA [Treponema sp.]|nr:flagellar biosynthesis protein FlhA [Treponema sp.]MBQ7619760.1 flagellar biosynthesis protein FlhA [Treponema sp.]
MAQEQVRQNNFLSFAGRNYIPVVAILVFLMLVIPLPTVLLDVFMAMNLAISVLLLLTVITTPKPSRLTTFPQIILLVTLFGLGINVSSTRLILTQGERFDGRMVRAFSTFVVGSDKGSDGLVVGMVIFIILIVIQTIVIAKGATRVSEVAARFALDSMPQKNFAVDQELNSGAITEEEARQKRAEIRNESDFYSAMDGSSKFVSGNVNAGIFITVINLVAGLITGMVLRREPFGSAIETYSRLTIGDGLLSQLPSLLLSFSTGMLVTASNSDVQLSENLKKQFSSSGTTYIIAGAAMALLGILPGMPWYVLIPLGGISVFAGIRMQRSQAAQELAKKQAEAAAAGKTQTGQNPADVSPVVKLDDLLLEIGYALIPLVDADKGAKLLERVTRIRREAALDLGLVVPSIRIVDNMTLDPNEYAFKIRGIEAGRSKLKMGYYMAINTGDIREEVKGEPTRDPAFGMPAIWIPEDKRADVERAGYAVVDPPTVIATHLTEIIRSHAAEILGRKEVKQIIDKLKETDQVVVDEVLDTAKFTYGQIEKVLQNLLREQVSIRNIVLILETLANYNPSVGSWILTERVREALGKQICLQYADESHKLRVMNLGQDYAELLLNHQVPSPDGSRPYAALDPVDGRRWIEDVSSAFAAMQERGLVPIILCPSEVRGLVKASTERELPGIVVLSINEVIAAENSVVVETLGEIKQKVEGVS